MGATYKYDDPVSNALASSSSVPNNIRNLDRSVGRQGTVSGTIKLDNAYATGGYAASPAKFGLSSVAGVIFETANGYKLYYNKTTGKIIVYSSGETEVTAATDLSAVPAIYFEAKGLV